MNNYPPYYPPYHAWHYHQMHGMPMHPHMMPYPYQPHYMPVQQPPLGLLGTVTSSSFVKGALIAGVATYVLTNEEVQNNMIKAAVQSWAVLQGGIEEMKERFRDAEAELHAAQMNDD